MQKKVLFWLLLPALTACNSPKLTPEEIIWQRCDSVLNAIQLTRPIFLRQNSISRIMVHSQSLKDAIRLLPRLLSMPPSKPLMKLVVAQSLSLTLPISLAPLLF